MSLISRIYYSIDRDNDEFHHRVSTWLDQFSIPLQSIEKYIRLIERNSRSIKTRITEFFQNFPATVFDIFIAFLHQKYLLILSMKIYRSNIKVFNIIIENHNNARNFENIILISLGINFIILAWAYCLIIKQNKMQGKQQYDESFINNERHHLHKRKYFGPLHPIQTFCI